MGEDYSTFPLLIDGKKVECVSVSEMSFSSEEEEWHDGKQRGLIKTTQTDSQQ